LIAAKHGVNYSTEHDTDATELLDEISLFMAQDADRLSSELVMRAFEIGVLAQNGCDVLSWLVKLPQFQTPPACYLQSLF